MIINAIIKYPGSKWGISDWIISKFPKHHSYLEPFFGSGAILFNKPRSNIETINDLDGEVVNLFECIKEDPERLARSIYFTPYSREVYDKASVEVTEDKWKKALNFYILLNMGHGFRTCGHKSGWKNDVQGRERSYCTLDWVNLPERILEAAERLRGVQIECTPAINLIERFNFPNVLIYCDPPYMPKTRNGKQYRCEMDEKEHEELLNILLKHKGYVVISGYDSALYNDALSGWNKYEKIQYVQSGAKRVEVVWLNFEPPKEQLTFEALFDSPSWLHL